MKNSLIFSIFGRVLVKFWSDSGQDFVEFFSKLPYGFFPYFCLVFLCAAVWFFYSRWCGFLACSEFAFSRLCLGSPLFRACVFCAIFRSPPGLLKVGSWDGPKCTRSERLFAVLRFKNSARICGLFIVKEEHTTRAARPRPPHRTASSGAIRYAASCLSLPRRRGPTCC